MSPGASRSAPALSQMLLRRNGFRAAELVVEEDARRHVGPLPPPVGQREQERQRLDQMRRQRRQRQLALVQRLAHQPELELLEVAQPAVEHLRRAARGAGGEVARLDERHLQPAGRGVERGAGADHAAADDDDVELLAAEPLPGLCALLGAEQGLPVARRRGDRVAHAEDPRYLLLVRYALLRPRLPAPQSRSSCAINRRPASVIEPDSDGYTEKRLRPGRRPSGRSAPPARSAGSAPTRSARPPRRRSPRRSPAGRRS